MLSRAAFVQQLQQINRWVYLGGPSPIRTQSSMLGLVNAVGTYGGAPNAGNLLQTIVEIGNIPAPKKIRYANAIRALQLSLPHPIYVTTAPFTLNTALVAGGIGVPRDNNVPNHQTDVILALQSLDNNGAGHALLQAISQQIVASNKRIAIQAWDLQQANKCAVAGINQDDCKTEVAYTLEFDRAAAGLAIANALTQLGHPAGYAWLEGEVDHCPIYDLVGVPAVNASSTVHGAGWVSQANIQSWVNGTAVFPAPLVGQMATDAAIVLGTVLDPGAAAKNGEHTVVRWSSASLTFTDTQGNQQHRPPYVALGHELIHAFHNISGDQPGHEIGTYSRVLYEYICIGLGRFAGAPHTENGIRAAAAGLAQRQCY